jgi:hypothetical protein
MPGETVQNLGMVSLGQRQAGGSVMRWRVVIELTEGDRTVHARPIPLILQWDENLDVSADTGTPVDDRDFQVPFRFTGKL